MMSAEKSDHLRRFDDVFKTLLVIASILLSGALAFYKELLPSAFFSAIIISFALSICTWVIGTFSDGVDEGIFKIVAWWALMTSFAATLARLIFYSTPLSLPRFGTTAIAVVSFLLSYPMFGYFRNLSRPRDLKILKILLIIASALVVAIDLIV
jgi:hypothetical protein